ncbi:MAG: VOC family protein [Christensenellaceae bacterium]
MIKKIDHVVITTEKMEACIAFYKKIGFEARESSGRQELFAGDFKINVHIRGGELHPHAQNVMSGSADLCLEVGGDIHQLKEEFIGKGIEIELGVVARMGTMGPMKSLYIRDVDGNLIEFCSYE